MAETTIENLAQEVRQLRSMIATHINNPFGHPTADGTVVDKTGFAGEYGFVAKTQIAQALGAPRYLADDTNIFSLKPGYYKCYKPAGLPSGIATQSSVWIIDVNYPVDAMDLGLITVSNDVGSKLVAARDRQGNWHWLRYGDKLKFGGDLANSGSYYTLIHTENKIQVHCHIDVETTLSKNSYKRLSNPYPSSLWLPEWDVKMESGINVVGSAYTGNTYQPVQLWFNPSLYVVNYSSVDLTHVWGDFRYDLDKF